MTAASGPAAPVGLDRRLGPGDAVVVGVGAMLAAGVAVRAVVTAPRPRTS